MDFTYHSDICRSVYIFHTKFLLPSQRTGTHHCIHAARRNTRALTIVFTPPVVRALSPLEAHNLCSVASHGHLPSKLIKPVHIKAILDASFSAMKIDYIRHYRQKS
jgi:hypothetical protein